MPVRRPVSARLGVEVLEDRTVPSGVASPPIVISPPIYGPPIPVPIRPIPIPVHGITISGSVTSFPWVVSTDIVIPPRLGVSPHFSLNIVVLDNGKVDACYRDTVRITFSGPGCITGLPSTYTFTAADAGRHSFNGYAPTPGSYSIRVTDTSNPQITHTFTFVVGYPRIMPLASS